MSKEINNNQMGKNEAKNLEISEDGRICAILAYFIIGIIWYFFDNKMKKNNFVKFHVKQAMGLIIADFLLMALLTISVIGLMLVPLFKLVAFVLAIVGIVNAVNGNKKELPIIGSYSSKLLKF